MQKFSYLFRNGYSFLRSLHFLELFVGDHAEDVGDPPDLGDDPLLDEVRGHDDEGHAEEEVGRADGDAGLRVVLLRLGDKVSEADGGEGDDAEVGGVEVVPALPVVEENGAHADVAEDHEAAQPNRNLKVTGRYDASKFNFNITRNIFKSFNYLYL